MRRKNKRTKEQVNQEAEHLAESLGHPLEERASEGYTSSITAYTRIQQ